MFYYRLFYTTHDVLSYQTGIWLVISISKLAFHPCPKMMLLMYRFFLFTKLCHSAHKDIQVCCVTDHKECSKFLDYYAFRDIAATLNVQPLIVAINKRTDVIRQCNNLLPCELLYSDSRLPYCYGCEQSFFVCSWFSYQGAVCLYRL